MKSRKRLLKKSRLYAILDREVLGKRPIANILREINNSSVDIIQIRDKLSDKKGILTRAQHARGLLTPDILFIVNDYIDVARIADSDGVHLGQDDFSVGIARRLLGRDKIIGVSCHNLRQALKAQDKGADYISLGPIFATPTKSDYKAVGLDIIKEVKKSIRIPFFVIGGINTGNMHRVLSYGAERIALCRSICQAKDIIMTANTFSGALR